MRIGSYAWGVGTYLLGALITCACGGSEFAPAPAVSGAASSSDAASMIEAGAPHDAVVDVANPGEKGIVFYEDAAGAAYDATTCSARPPSPCRVTAGSDDAAEQLAACDTAIAECVAAAPADGCHTWTFVLDATSCLQQVIFRGDDVQRTEAEGYRAYRECLERALTSRTWPSLAGQSVTFYESCLIQMR